MAISRFTFVSYKNYKSNKVKVLLVDDNKKFRESLKFLITGRKELEVVGEASNGEEALELAQKYQSDLILMDLEMPNMDGISAGKRLLWKCPNLKILAISLYNDKAYLIELINAGFKGFISKNEIATELDLALDTVLNGEIFFPNYINLIK